MWTRLLLALLVAFTGAGLTLQIAWNARLRQATGSPLFTTIISVVVTLLVLLIAWAVAPGGKLPAFNSVPRWAWCGGFFGALYLFLSLLAAPRLGASATFALIIAGQMIAAFILDVTGAFGMPRFESSYGRLAGIVLLLSGALLLLRR
jgi:bacterial/archaeal transporter family-2 protein